MSLRDEIFPAERNPSFVQTEWATDWEDGVAAFGYTAEYLTDHAGDFGARIDQVGLAVFYLQRHRVELTLKGIIAATGGAVSNTHSLERLWNECGRLLKARDAKGWEKLDASQSELIHVLHDVDQTSETFRYPVTRSGEVASRPAFIDLVVLDRHVEAFYFAFSGFMDYLADGE